MKRWLAKRPRFHLHFTPTHGSWINQVERWFGLLSERKIKRGAHRSVSALKAAIQDYLDVNNSEPKPFVWTKTPTTSSPTSRASLAARAKLTRDDL